MQNKLFVFFGTNILTILCSIYKIQLGGDEMNSNFLITKIHNVLFIGKNEHPRPEVDFTHDLPCNELILHLSGKSTVYFNNKEFKTTENHLRFLPKGKCDKYIVKKEEFGECIDVFFDTDIPVSQEAFVINIKNNIRFGNLFKKLFSVWVAKHNGYYFECLSLINKIFSEMQKSNYIPENQYNQIKPAIDYIENHFLTEKISVVYLANICNISESYLKKLFIKKFGIPPTKYIIQLKINYACDLLQSGLYNITQISEMCGYSDVYFFSHQFKEYIGISPTEFLNKYKSSK